MSDQERDDYLWDRSGTPDPEVQRLESLLQPFAHRRSLPQLPARAQTEARTRGSRRFLRMAGGAGAIAASLLLGLTIWFGWGIWRGGWTVQALSGSPAIDGESLGDAGLLRRGGKLVTDGASRARIVVGRIGRVDVDPDSRLELVNAGGRDHRLSLERGTIHARISAPPRFFFVNTPSATAIDLGCAYTLQVDDRGGGFLRVTHGWVLLDYGGRQAYIPQGAMCATRAGVGPGTPYFADAPPRFPWALGLLDFGDPDPGVRAEAVHLLLTESRRVDALTIWHLLTRGSESERARFYDRLVKLAPPPAGVTREKVLAGDRRALDEWWDSFEFEGTRWWQRLKKKL
jgi:ferric-dicitrate binding protein FerR (iron transport regulator)